MRKNIKFLSLIFVCGAVLMFIAGCGDKSADTVVKKIEGTLSELEGYKIAADMTMKTGKEDQEYEVDVWYKKGEEDFYRVGLANKEDDEDQVILKNKEGVFVLTPALNKSFKFQTDWPGNSSQPYLYQSLVEDVVTDQEANFSVTDNHYVFETKTNYQNNTNLPYQEVYFDKKTYAPTAVKVLDKDKNALVEVSFQHLDTDPAFTKVDFDREDILKDKATDTEVSNIEKPQELAVTFPLETLGAELVEKEEVALDEGERVIMTFKGDRNFTLIQEQKLTEQASATVEQIQGDVVHVGHGFGALSDNALEWNEDGVQFYLASEDMTIEELMEVATTIEGKEAK